MRFRSMKLILLNKFDLSWVLRSDNQPKRTGKDFPKH